MQYKVIEAVDYLGTNPTESVFEFKYEAWHYVMDRVEDRVNDSLWDGSLQRYQSLSEKEYNDLFQYESTFFRVEEIH